VTALSGRSLARWSSTAPVAPVAALATKSSAVAAGPSGHA
jgi:hypothetical protein